jgi:hypothetical protein
MADDGDLEAARGASVPRARVTWVARVSAGVEYAASMALLPPRPLRLRADFLLSRFGGGALMLAISALEIFRLITIPGELGEAALTQLAAIGTTLWLGVVLLRAGLLARSAAADSEEVIVELTAIDRERKRRIRASLAGEIRS